MSYQSVASSSKVVLHDSALLNSFNVFA